MKLTVSRKFTLYGIMQNGIPSVNADRYRRYLVTRKALNDINRTLSFGDSKGLCSFVDAGETLKYHIRKFRDRLRVESVKYYHLEFSVYGTVCSVEGLVLKDLLAARRKRIQAIRRGRRELFMTRPQRYARSYRYVEPLMVGGVHADADFYGRLYRSKLAKMVYESKLPKTSEPHVGIELEFTAAADRQTLGSALFDAGLAPFVTLKADGSIRVTKDNHHPHELAICVPQSNVETIVKRVTKVLGMYNASVNTSTGMHTHIDVRYRDRSKVFSRLVAAQSVLYAMQPASRRDNRYCKRTVSRCLNTANNAGRYQGVNPQSVSKYNTVEVRLHAGTVNADKIINWVNLLVSIVENEYAEPQRAPRTLETFCKTFMINERLKEYVKNRIEMFKGTAADTEEAS